jgi:hypothetical protein
VARALALLLYGALFLSCWLRRLEPERAAFLLLGGFLVLSPTLHPWYLTWIVPFLALFPALSWTFLLAAAPLLYWPLAGWREHGTWSEPPWLWPVLALPFLALLSVDLARARRPRP